MEEALLLIASVQGWIYALTLLAGLVYLRLALKWHAEVKRARFSLERERASSHRLRAMVMLGLVASGAGATFALSTFLVPAVPLPIPTPVPTISLLQAAGSPPVSASTPDSSGCLNPSATITEPEAGAELRGLVEVRGTADIPGFAFYRIEVREAGPQTPWQVITAGNEVRSDELLGVWDTSLVDNGVYLLQLVVTDAGGNAPLPCSIEVVVLPPGG